MGPCLQDDEEAVVGRLCEVMGEDIAYLGLIHQLLVCEDSLHAANSPMGTVRPNPLGTVRLDPPVV